MGILINGKTSTVDELLNICKYDDGEYDIDNIFFPMNSDLLEEVINSMETSYDIKSVIETYLSMSNENLTYNI